MENILGNIGLEMHPLFPSGDWEGFYTYAMGPGADRHKMQFELYFRNNLVRGQGVDDRAAFTWKGTYDKTQMECVMTKFYDSHTVFYKGQVDENGIWGVWQIPPVDGGFHIWPKKSQENQEAKALEMKERSMVVAEPLAVPKKEEALKPLEKPRIPE